MTKNKFEICFLHNVDLKSIAEHLITLLKYKFEIYFRRIHNLNNNA